MTRRADEDTMSYNSKWGGTIPFPKEKVVISFFSDKLYAAVFFTKNLDLQSIL